MGTSPAVHNFSGAGSHPASSTGMRPHSVQTMLCAVGFALIVSLASQMNKLIADFQLPFLVLFFRYLFSFTGSFLLQKMNLIHCCFRGKKNHPLLAVNALVYAASHACQIIGLFFAPSILNAILFATVPVWAEILAFFILKERPGLLQTCLVLFSIASLITMLLLGQGEKAGAISLIGFGLLLGSCILEAFNNILIRFLKTDYSPVEIGFSASGISLAVCSVILCVQCAATHTHPGILFQTALQPSFLFPVLYLGLGCTLASGILKGVILQRMTALKASAWSNVASALSIMFGVVLLHERFHVYQLACSIGIISSVIGIQACSVFSQDHKLVCRR